MRDSRFPWPLGALLVVLIVGGIGFWLGAGSVVAPVAAPVAGATVVYPAYGFHFFGFPFFGLFIGLLFLFLIFGLIRRAAWGHRAGPGWRGDHGYDMSGYRGAGRWAGKEVPPMADDMLQRWHRRAHGEPEPAEPTTPPGPTDPSI